MTPRLLHEPLLLFFAAGAALFAGHRWLHPGDVSASRAPQRIEMTADDVRQMTVAWLASGRPAPTPEQTQRLVDAWVRDEILFREALALGLDQNDAIVKRRLVQKMDFLAEDLSALREPTDDELVAWFRAHPDRFAEPAHVTFRHVYFSPDRRGGPAGAEAAAATALATLAGKAVDGPEAAAAGDPFMAQRQYPERTAADVAKDFGPPFADAVFALAPGTWQGPVVSGLGAHLVFVETHVPARVPAYEAVADAVRADWVAAQRDEWKRVAYETMRARYEVVLPDAP